MSTLDEITMGRDMTKRIRAIVTDEVLWEKCYKYCKKLGNSSHAPVALSDYRKMQKFTDDNELTTTVFKAMKDYLPGNDKYNLDGFDIIGYFYSIALLSQTTHNREDILIYLRELTDYVITNNNMYGSTLYRNMKRLKKDFPDLEEFEKKLKVFDA